MKFSACNKKQWRKSLLQFLISSTIGALLIAYGIYSIKNNVLLGLFFMAFSGFPIIIALSYLLNMMDAKKTFDIINGMDEMDFSDYAMKLNSEKDTSKEVLNRMIESNYLIAYLNDANIIVTNGSKQFSKEAYLDYKEKVKKDNSLKQELKKQKQEEQYLTKMMKKGKAVRCPDCGTVYPKNTSCPNCGHQIS